MFKMPSSVLLSATFGTIVVTAIASSPLTTLGQTSPAPNNVNKTGCLSGYPNGRYQGDRSITRNEFAAGLNACLNQVDQLIPTNTNLGTRADFQVLIERQRKLNQQLRELNERVSTPSTRKSSNSTIP